MLRRFATLTALVTAVLTALTGVVHAAPTPPRAYPSAIERYASYAPQTTCSPTAKPGVVSFRDQVLRSYPWTRSLGIVRACNVGGRSEHKEGRALDWGVNASSSRDVAAVNDLFKWLFATDRYGNRHAMARRLGIQYVIWNRKIWGSYAVSEGWRTYTGASPHTDHVHFSFSWPGARKTTSYWTGTVGSTTAPPPTGGGSDGSTPMPDDDAYAEPLPPSRLLAGPALATAERLYLSARRPAGATTVNALQAGQPYLVEVTGTYVYKPGARADAECSNSASAPGTWVAQRSLTRTSPDADNLDVYLNGIDGRFEGNDGERCDPKNHTYRWTYVPERTGRANLRLWDTKFSDNSGGLLVKVYKLTTDDADHSFALAATAPAGATPKVLFQGGTRYVVQVEGTWMLNATRTGDAECVATTAGWVRRYPNGIDYDGVLLNARDEWGKELVDTGGHCDKQTHTYRFEWTPHDDTTLTARVPDARHADNAGTLKVRVVRADLASRLPGPPAPPPEVLTVDASDADGVRTARSYADSGSYEVVVRGSYDAGNGVTADAECSATTTDATWRRRRESSLSRQLLWDLAVDGKLLDWQPLAGGDGCSPTHEYRVVLSPRDDGPLWLGVYDKTYADNAGSLTVTIRKV